MWMCVCVCVCVRFMRVEVPREMKIQRRIPEWWGIMWGIHAYCVSMLNSGEQDKHIAPQNVMYVLIYMNPCITEGGDEFALSNLKLTTWLYGGLNPFQKHEPSY